MSPTRRTLLQGLAALPVAAMPAFACAAAISPDAALIALAGRVAKLVRLDDAAAARSCDATSRYEAVEPDRVPDNCQAEINAAWRAEMDACPPEADDEIVQAHARRAGQAAKAIKERHAALVAAYEEACQRLLQETGLDRAEKVSSWLCDRLKAAAAELTAAEARTMPGLVAKASASAAIIKTWGSRDEWITDLAESVVHDLLRVGGES
jgi:hypothetical protein